MYQQLQLAPSEQGRKGSRMALVLCAGADPVLMQARKHILESAGHTVIAATDERQVADACRQYAFNVTVIGQTVSPNIKRYFCSLIRQYSPSARIMELYSAHHGKALEDVDSWLEIPTKVPQELADRVTELAQSAKRRFRADH